LSRGKNVFSKFIRERIREFLLGLIFYTINVTVNIQDIVKAITDRVRGPYIVLVWLALDLSLHSLMVQSRRGVIARYDISV